MNSIEVAKAQKTTLIGVFALIMMVVFSAEVTIMQLFEELFLTLSIVESALLDATSLVIIIALPLWFFVFKPACTHENDGICLKTAIFLYALVLGGLFLIQLSIMFFLSMPGFSLKVPAEIESLVDGTLTVLMSAPLFWWLLHRLELNNRLEPLADFLHAPKTLYVLLLFMIFLADILQEIIFHELGIEMTGIGPELFDAFITVVLVSPLLMILIVKPLNRLARSESARTNIVYDQVIEGIIKIDRDGLVQSFNLAAQSIFGIPTHEMLGKPVSQLFDKKQIIFDLVLQNLAADEENKPLKFFELRSQRHDGSLLTIDMSISKVESDGPDEYMLLLRDISRSKATEKALLESDATFREIFNQTEDAIIFLNRRVLRFWMLTPGPRASSDIAGTNYRNLA